MSKSLEEVFKAQQEFENLFVDFERLEQGDSKYLDEIADYLSTALAREAFEFRDEFNWKVNTRTKLHVRDKQLEEAIDCFTFSVNLLLILGVHAEQAIEWYFLKRSINIDKAIREGIIGASDLKRSE